MTAVEKWPFVADMHNLFHASHQNTATISFIFVMQLIF